LPWDGLSFKNLLATGSSSPEATALRGLSLANKRQQERILFTLVPHCWDADAVPELDENRCGRLQSFNPLVLGLYQTSIV
jgi:hypothetical protein